MKTQHQMVLAALVLAVTSGTWAEGGVMAMAARAAEIHIAPQPQAHHGRRQHLRVDEYPQGHSLEAQEANAYSFP